LDIPRSTLQYWLERKSSIDADPEYWHFLRVRLVLLFCAEEMVSKKVTVCQDETLHPEICLVAIEPVSNFILFEKYAASRKAKEWAIALKEASGELPIEVVHSTRDEERGILHHVKEDPGAHHSPDVFHVNMELLRLPALHSPVNGVKRSFSIHGMQNLFRS
jgi:hypothetical protein